MISYSAICGVQLGVEMFEQQVEDFVIGYVLIDIFILRIQIAWYVE